MINAQNTAIQQVIDPVANAGATTASEIDGAGYDYCTIYVIIGNLGSNASAFEVQESDTSGSGFVLIPGCDFDGGTDIDGSVAALPLAASGDNKTFVFEINLNGRKRYLKPVITIGGSGSSVSCIAVLNRSSESPVTLAARNLDSSVGNIVRV